MGETFVTADKKMRNITPNAEDFQKRLEGILRDAQQQGENFVDIKSGDLHRKVGGYPGSNHRMPICCRVMRKEMKSADKILEAPPKGDGATLIIRYYLPR